MSDSAKQYIDLYRENRDDIFRYSDEIMNASRDEAFRAFSSLGFPSRKVEEYKYTDVSGAFAPDYGVNLRRVVFPVNPYEAFRCNVPNMSTLLYFVENDTFCSRFLPRAPLPEGIFVGSMHDFALKYPLVAANHYGRRCDADSDALSALNTMLAQDCLVIYAAPGVKLARTLQIVNILRSDVDIMVSRRVLVIASEGSELSLLFCEHNADPRNFLTNEVIEVSAGKDSRLEIYSLEQTLPLNRRFSSLFVEQEAGSRVLLNSMTLHGGLTRNRLRVSLRGERAEVDAYGFALEHGKQHVDTNALINHAVAKCRSNVLYKYVVDGESVGAFAGKVYVSPGAEKTESQETNANICVSPQARMYSQPMLEIYADDVKCNHGATIGRFDDAAMFYMEQRGVSEQEAHLLLEYAFVDEVLQHIPLIPLRDRIARLVEKKFRGELVSCPDCNAC